MQIARAYKAAMRTLFEVHVHFFYFRHDGMDKKTAHTWLDLDQQHVWHPYTPLRGTSPLLITKASGVYLYTAEGRKILDAVSSWWVNLHGHAHPALVKALSEQAQVLEHVIFAGFTHRPALALSKALLGALPAGQFARIFFSDDGSTAVEVALKMAIQYGVQERPARPRHKIMALAGAYHGDTFGAMSVSDRGSFTIPFRSYLFDTVRIPFPYPSCEKAAMDTLKKALRAPDMAAFIFEPLVQGTGGMRFYAPEWLDEALSYAQKHGVLCIADEVFTGFGRTGRLFAMDHLTHKPDIVALSKGLTGGMMPLGATLCNAKVSAAFEHEALSKTFFHGHSYTANPLACRVGEESLRLLQERACQTRIARISTLQKTFAKHVCTHPQVQDARALGTILALTLASTEATSYSHSLREEIYRFFLEKDILLRPLGNVLYVLPPYVMEDKELSHIHRSIENFLEHLKTHR